MFESFMKSGEGEEEKITVNYNEDERERFFCVTELRNYGSIRRAEEEEN